MKKFILILIAAFAVNTVSAQSVKLGRINSNDVLTSLAEVDSVRVKVEAHAKEMQGDYEVMTVEFNKKLEDYNKNKATMSQLLMSQKEKELQSLQQSLQEFGEGAQQEMANVQESLMAPIQAKIQESINKVAKASSLTLVIEDAAAVGSAYAYIDKNAVMDITPLVVKDLGGTLKPAATTPAAK